MIGPVEDHGGAVMGVEVWDDFRVVHRQRSIFFFSLDFHGSGWIPGSARGCSSSSRAVAVPEKGGAVFWVLVVSKKAVGRREWDEWDGGGDNGGKWFVW